MRCAVPQRRDHHEVTVWAIQHAAVVSIVIRATQPRAVPHPLAFVEVLFQQELCETEQFHAQNQLCRHHDSDNTDCVGCVLLNIHPHGAAVAIHNGW